MRRPRGQGLLGGAIGTTMPLLLAACGGSSDEAAPTPEPTVAIAEAPTATTVPADPTATPEPTADPTATPEPTAEPELTVEEQVIAAWERYWDLAVQARGESPSPEALAFDAYAAEEQVATLRELVANQRDEGYFLAGRVTVGEADLEFRGSESVIVNDCVGVMFQRISLDDGVELSSQDETRSVRARLELDDGGWRVHAVETGGTC